MNVFLKKKENHSVPIVVGVCKLSCFLQNARFFFWASKWNETRTSKRLKRMRIMKLASELRKELQKNKVIMCKAFFFVFIIILMMLELRFLWALGLASCNWTAGKKYTLMIEDSEAWTEKDVKWRRRWQNGEQNQSFSKNKQKENKKIQMQTFYILLQHMHALRCKQTWKYLLAFDRADSRLEFSRQLNTLRRPLDRKDKQLNARRWKWQTTIELTHLIY